MNAPMPTPVVWWRSGYDGLAHALMLGEVADKTKQSVRALCSHTAPVGEWSPLDKPVEPVDVVCLLEVGSLLPDPAAVHGPGWHLHRR